MRGRFLLHALLLVACSCATGYQPKDWLHNPTGGYSHVQLEENIFRVSFFGNAVTPYEQASDFALLRATELALEHGYAYFVIRDSKMGFKTFPGTTAPVQSTAGRVSVGVSVGSPSYPNPWYTVVCYEERPQTDAEVTDARLLRDSLRRKYEMTPEDPAPPLGPESPR